MGDGEATTTTRGHVPHYIEDLDWLINDAPAALGEKGLTQDPSGGGAKTRADNWDFIERAHAAMPDVRRQRRLLPIWNRLTAREQNVAAAYYTRRQALIVTGAQAAFGQHARVALLLAGTGPEREDLVRALGNQTNARHVPTITAARKGAQQAVAGVHASWVTAKRIVAHAWAEGD